MGRSLSEIMRSGQLYGSQATGTRADAARSMGWLMQRAGQDRARGIEARGRNLSSTISNVGNLAAQAISGHDRREQEAEERDLQMQMQREQLGITQEKHDQLRQARDEEQTYIKIISENRGKPAEIMRALNESGLPHRADEYFGRMQEVRKKVADANESEIKEIRAGLNGVGQLFGNFLSETPEDQRDALYPEMLRRAEPFLRETAPELLDQLPETPEEGTYEMLQGLAAMSIDTVDLMKIKTSEVNLAEKQFDLESKQATADDEALKGSLQIMSRRRSKATWGPERQAQLDKLPESKRADFERMVEAEYNPKNRDELRSYLGDKTGFTGEYGNYMKHRQMMGKPTEEALSPMEFKKQAAKITGTEGKKFTGEYANYVNSEMAAGTDSPNILTHRNWEQMRGKEKGGVKGLSSGQALSALRFIQSEARTRQENGEFDFEMPMPEIEAAIAKEKNWSLDELRAQAGGEATPGSAPGSAPAAPAPPAQAAQAAPTQRPVGTIVTLKDGRKLRRVEGGWQEVQ